MLNPRAYCAEVVEYLRNMLVVSVVTSPQEWQGLIEASAEDLAQMAADAHSSAPGPRFRNCLRSSHKRRSRSGSVPILGSCSKLQAVRATRILGRTNREGSPKRCSQPRHRPPQAAPVRTGQPVSQARSADPTPSLPPRPPQSTATIATAPMPSRSSVVGSTASPQGLSANSPTARPPGAAGEVKSFNACGIALN